MTHKIRPFIFSLLFPTMLFLAMLGAFSIFASSTSADEGVQCKTIPAGCGSFGCNGNPGSYTCSLYAIQEGAVCTSGGPCSTGYFD